MTWPESNGKQDLGGGGSPQRGVELAQPLEEGVEHEMQGLTLWKSRLQKFSLKGERALLPFFASSHPSSVMNGLVRQAANEQKAHQNLRAMPQVSLFSHPSSITTAIPKGHPGEVPERCCYPGPVASCILRSPSVPSRRSHVLHVFYPDPLVIPGRHPVPDPRLSAVRHVSLLTTTCLAF